MGDNYNYDYNKKLEANRTTLRNYQKEVKIRDQQIDDLLVVIDKIKLKHAKAIKRSKRLLEKQRDVSHKLIRENKELRDKYNDCTCID